MVQYLFFSFFPCRRTCCVFLLGFPSPELASVVFTFSILRFRFWICAPERKASCHVVRKTFNIAYPNKQCRRRTLSASLLLSLGGMQGEQHEDEVIAGMKRRCTDGACACDSEAPPGAALEIAQLQVLQVCIATNSHFLDSIAAVCARASHALCPFNPARPCCRCVSMSTT